MIIGTITVGTAAVQLTGLSPSAGFPSLFPANTLKIGARGANASAVYLGTTSGVTTGNGLLLPQLPSAVGVDAGASYLTITPFPVWLVASGAGQVVDYIAY